MLTTSKNQFGRLVAAIVGMLMGLLGLAVAATPAQAKDWGHLVDAANAATVLVDISWKTDATWTDETGQPQHQPIYGNTQASGFYVTADGKFISAAVAYDASNWRVRQAVEASWESLWLGDLDYEAAQPVWNSLNLGEIVIDNITVTDMANRAGVEPPFKVVATSETGYALLAPDKQLSVEPFTSIASSEPTERYLDIRHGEYDALMKLDGASRVPVEPTELDGRAVHMLNAWSDSTYRADPELKALAERNAILGGFAVNDDYTEIYGVVSEDRGGSGTFYLLSTADLREFMQSQSLAVTSASAPASEPSASASSDAGTSPQASAEAPSVAPTDDAAASENVDVAQPAASGDEQKLSPWLLGVLVIGMIIVGISFLRAPAEPMDLAVDPDLADTQEIPVVDDEDA